MTANKFSDDVREFVNHFDTKIERFLDFDERLKEHLEYLMETMNVWDKIAAACRRMIICDRELDLKKGKFLIDKTDNSKFESYAK